MTLEEQNDNTILLIIKRGGALGVGYLQRLIQVDNFIVLIVLNTYFIIENIFCILVIV